VAAILLAMFGLYRESVRLYPSINTILLALLLVPQKVRVSGARGWPQSEWQLPGPVSRSAAADLTQRVYGDRAWYAGVPRAPAKEIARGLPCFARVGTY
jgi:hypothetical protein